MRVSWFSVLIIGLILTANRGWAQSATIPGGKYLIGAPTEQYGILPQTDSLVTILEFEMTLCEITNSEFARFLNEEHEEHYDPRMEIARRDGRFVPYVGREGYPVSWVDWHAAVAYASWAGGRLPTAIEWEAAARGNSYGETITRHDQPVAAGRIWSWGNDSTRTDLGKCLDTPLAVSGSLACWPCGTGGVQGPYGHNDLSGNLAEWTATPATGASREYLVKGGSWLDPIENLRTAVVITRPDYYRSPGLGFRVVIER